MKELQIPENVMRGIQRRRVSPHTPEFMDELMGEEIDGWIVLDQVYRKWHHKRVLTVCNCGYEKEMPVSRLVNNKSKRCWVCTRRENATYARNVCAEEHGIDTLELMTLIKAANRREKAICAGVFQIAVCG